MIEKILEVKQLDVEVPGSLLIQQLSFQPTQGHYYASPAITGLAKQP
ncbi:hypothetical protein ACXJ5A_03955 [Leuconostoc mesenteroides]|nr:hypothetical protein [Leuconostoc mesenteroides]